MKASESGLSFFCISCGTTGPRRDSYIPRKRQVPSFADICPRCSSDDVEVFDARHSMASEQLN